MSCNKNTKENKKNAKDNSPRETSLGEHLFACGKPKFIFNYIPDITFISSNTNTAKMIGLIILTPLCITIPAPV